MSEVEAIRIALKNDKDFLDQVVRARGAGGGRRRTNHAGPERHR